MMPKNPRMCTTKMITSMRGSKLPGSKFTTNARLSEAQTINVPSQGRAL